MNIKMFCLDVEKKNFFKLMNALSINKNYLGGAITNPYKEEAYKYLNSSIDDSSKSIGAINCIYRKKGKLFGTNTDGYGAIFSLKKLGEIKDKKFLIIGTGGTALTLVSFLSTYTSSKKNIIVTGRNNNKLKKFKIKFNCKIITLSNIYEFDNKFDFLVNCTDVGSSQKKTSSILPLSYFNLLSKSTNILDLIYNPKETLFLKYAKKNFLRTSNGLMMNLHQAVSAFVITNKIKKIYYDEITNIMTK